jgi:3-methylcrotonyl-CoA carboxylase alpha subunit
MHHETGECRMFDTVLIANRGEIACRIIATCRRMAIRTVAVYSDADANSRHVRLADTAVRIGPPPARESYLAIDRILEAAKATGAQAIHPGYGFLAENAEFAEACARAGFVFIGPPPAAIRAMGSKAAAKHLMREAGVPMTPGYDGPNQDPEFLEKQAGAIGYPVMIKANAGGGGKGMRRVNAREQFQAALAGCRREAVAAFGDDSVLIEKYLVGPRHVEVQVFGDTHGNVISLFERDCSVQRRNQKVIEEAPAPQISEKLRDALSEAGRRAAGAVSYVGAGTVEFLVDREGGFHFMEMNTRLQVEHPVTEMITGLDLVEWQLRVAAGEPLPLKQEGLTMHGDAIEARIYAEDPAHDFLPSIGRLVHLRFPATSEHVRVDSGVEQGDTITQFYDPMIAKLVAWDETRELASLKLRQALSDVQIVGVANNVGFLERLVTSPSFAEARLDTGLIEREHNWIAAAEDAPQNDAFALAALAMILMGRNEAIAGLPISPWAARDGWRMNGRYARAFDFKHGEDTTTVIVDYGDGTYRASVGSSFYEVSGELETDGSLFALIDGKSRRVNVIQTKGKLHVFLEGKRVLLTYDDPLDVEMKYGSKESNFLAPMPGRVIALSVRPGERVEKGAALMVLEAMKMECTIHAPVPGSVGEFHFSAGDQVNEGAELLRFDRDDEGS